MSLLRKNITLYLATFHLGLMLIIALFSNKLLTWLRLSTSGNVDELDILPKISSSHILGTNHMGQDLMSLIISGAQYSLGISFFSAVVAVFIGISIGSVAGYFGDKNIRVKRFQLLSAILTIPVVLFYIFLSLKTRTFFQSGIAILSGTLVSYVVWKVLIIFLGKTLLLKQFVNLPIDIFNTKIAEIFFAVPAYFIILSFSPFLGDSMWTMIFILGVTSWPQSALLIRAEVLKIREMHYIDALKLSGLGNFRIIAFHVIPNSISPVLVNFVFFISGLLIIESSLSYIGIGFSSDILTWGKIINGFKTNSANWWVAIFPGIVIFLTILSFHRIGHWAEKKFL